MNVKSSSFTYSIFSKCIYILNYLIPKKKQIYFFSAMRHADNIEALFREFLRHEESKQFVLIRDSLKDQVQPNNNIIDVRHLSFQAIWAYLRSSYVFFDIGCYGTNKPPKNQIIVNTWHGMPFKKVGTFVDNVNKAAEPTSSYVVSTSIFFADVMAQAFGLQKEKVLCTNEPRIDYFFDECEYSLNKLKINKPSYGKILLWMPTYRKHVLTNEVDGGNYDFGIPLLTRENIYDLDKVCKDNNVLLLIKWHGLQAADDIRNIPFTNIRFITSDDIRKAGVPLYHVVACSDGLITDYSSIFVNYLVLDRPICFAYDDFEEYKSKRGFLFPNMKEVMPGVHALTFEQLLSYISSFAKGIDNFRMERKRVNGILNGYCDNKNSYRILKAVGLLK